MTKRVGLRRAKANFAEQRALSLGKGQGVEGPGPPGGGGDRGLYCRLWFRVEQWNILRAAKSMDSGVDLLHCCQ